jgi:hypothetical protein
MTNMPPATADRPAKAARCSSQQAEMDEKSSEAVKTQEDWQKNHSWMILMACKDIVQML